jgi:hypothetical protein
MRIKKPLISTILFAGILLAGIAVLYILVSKALETDVNNLNGDTVSQMDEIERTS